MNKEAIVSIAKQEIANEKENQKIKSVKYWLEVLEEKEDEIKHAQSKIASILEEG